MGGKILYGALVESIPSGCILGLGLLENTLNISAETLPSHHVLSGDGEPVVEQEHNQATASTSADHLGERGSDFIYCLTHFISGVVGALTYKYGSRMLSNEKS
jgi:hypothetical protein